MAEDVYCFANGSDLIQEKNEYGFGVAGPTLSHDVGGPFVATTPSCGSPTPTRATTYGYAISAIPCMQVVHDASGQVAAEIDAYLDGGTQPCVSGRAATQAVSDLPNGTHDEANYAASATVARGNPTTVTKWLNTGGLIATTATYDETGQILTSTDVCGNTPCGDMSGSDHTTAYSYNDSFTIGTPSGNTNAYVTRITSPSTNGVAHQESYSYSLQDGKLTGVSDENGRSTTYIYNTKAPGCDLADSLDRLTEVYLPDGGRTVYCYNDVAPSPTMKTVQLMNIGGDTKTNVAVFDGMGHVVKNQIVVSSNEANYIETVYNGMGGVYSVSNPDNVGNPSTDLTTTFSYDALGRKIFATSTDGSRQQWCYNGVASAGQTNCRGNASTHAVGLWIDDSDEAGKRWQRVSDAFGRLVAVVEPTATETDYGYSTLNDLLTVTQQGAANESPLSRSFTYDSLSRLITATNPETGTICYGQWSGSSCQGGYDANSNLLFKTDANGSTLSYAYDALNRMTAKSDGYTAYNYVYDQGANAIGRLYAEYNTSGGAGSAFAYDALGRVTTTGWVNYVAGTWAWQTGMQAQYDLAGNMTQLTYPNGAVLQQAYDGAGRLQSITDATPGGPGTVYFQPTAGTSQYWASGALHSAKLGNGVVETTTLNSRLQPCQMVAESPVTTGPGITLDPATHMGVLLNRQLFYGSTAEANCGAAAGNNGNIWHITEENGGQQNFGYDGLNRLTSAFSANRPAASSYNFNYSYDSFGNMLPTDNSNGNLPFSIDPVTNRMMNGSNIIYSPNGNLAFANGHSFAYNTYGYLQQIDGYATGSYVYNGMGERTLSVRNDNGDHSRFSLSTNVYLGGQPMAEYHLDSLSVPWTWTNYVYASGQKIARLVGSGPTAPAVSYYLDDHLGTAQMELSANGTPTWSGWYTPFGQEITSGWASNYIGNQPADGTSMRYKFTGKERDTESGLDYFGARYYASSMGRWMSPDWADKPEGVPYSDLSNPQSLNLYAYVGNNPLSRADKDGHCFPFCIPALAGAGGETLALGAAGTAGEAGFGAFIASNPVGWAVGASIVVVGGGALIYEHYHPGAITGLFSKSTEVGTATAGAKGAVETAEETNKQAEAVLGSGAATGAAAEKLGEHVADQVKGIAATKAAVATLAGAKGKDATQKALKEVNKQVDLLKGHAKDIAQQLNKIKKDQ